MPRDPKDISLTAGQRQQRRIGELDDQKDPIRLRVGAGPAGATGAEGPPGADGEDGIDGSVWYVGAGAPSESTGVSGDFYLNATNGDVYKKTGSTWNLTANIKGEKGEKGATGAAGKDGLPGEKGAEGVSGEGPVILEGVGDPAATTGNIGNWYLDRRAGALWGPKDTKEQWTRVNLITNPYIGGLSGSGWGASGVTTEVVTLTDKGVPNLTLSQGVVKTGLRMVSSSGAGSRRVWAAAVTNGTRYRFSKYVHLKSMSSELAVIQIRVRNAAGTVVATGSSTKVLNEWVRLDVDFTAAATENHTLEILQAAGGGVSEWFQTAALFEATPSLNPYTPTPEQLSSGLSIWSGTENASVSTHRKVKQVTDGSINVRDYGALGATLSADDSKAIQAALNAVDSTSGRTTVIIPDGFKFVATNLQPKSGTIFEGGGELLHKEKSTTPLIDISSSVTDVTIRDLFIDGNKAAQTTSTIKAIQIAGSRHSLENCKIKETIQDAVYVQPNATDVKINGNYIDGTGRFGATIGGNSAADAPQRITMTGNYVRNTNDGALGIVGVGKYVRFEDNVLWGTIAGDGIAAYNRENVHIVANNNTILEPKNHGIHLGGKFLTADGNDIIKPQFNAIIFASDPNESPTAGGVDSIVGNTIDAPGRGLNAANGAGVYCVNRTGVSVSGNSIEAPYGHGINLEGCIDGTVSGNTALNSTAGVNIRLSSCTRIVESGNHTNPTTLLTAGASLVLPRGVNLFHINSGGTISGINSSSAAFERQVTLIFDGTTTVSDAGNIVLAEAFSATAGDTLTLVCDGIDWYEVSRSSN